MPRSVGSSDTLVHSNRSSTDWTVGAADRPLFEAEMEEGKGREKPEWSTGAGIFANSRIELPPQFYQVKSFVMSSNRVSRQARIRIFVLVACAIFILLASFHTQAPSRLREHIHKATASSNEPSKSSLDQKFEVNQSRNGLWPETLAPGQPSKLCDICDCSVSPGLYNPKESATKYLPRPNPDIVRPVEGSINYNEYLRQTILDLYCTREHMTTAQTTRLVRRTSAHFDQMASWNITGLDMDKPTIYMMTSTSPNDKTEDKRPQYFRRHARQMQRWLDNRTDQEGNIDWQILWVIVEDELDIDPELVRTIQRIGIPYVYFAYGPTNSLANAQKNANLQMVHSLARDRAQGGLFGHGPVYGLDDDNKILPELLDYLVQVQQIGVLPVGNFGTTDGYEKPILNYIGEVMGSESPWFTRKYPFDYGGFTFNSSLLGTQISGPMFWKHTQYAGESEFIDQIVGDIREVEPLCGPQLVQDCHVVWHNEPLTKIEELTDLEEDAFLKSYGANEWERRLEEQEDRREDERGY
jgi:Glycosyltransferase family 43